MMYISTTNRPFVRVETSGDDALIYITSYEQCPCCGRIIRMSKPSLYRTIPLAQYKAMIEHDRLTF